MSKYIFHIILVILAFSGCANPLPPPGGPPDTTPPAIVESAPANGTTNFREDYVSIVFSEYMDRNKVLENIFISPRTEMEFDWGGKELEIEFVNPLEENTTYALTLGTDYTDLSGNKPENAYTLIFSTGSVIDTGIISGIVHDPSPSGVYIYAYRLDNRNPDTLDPRRTRPDYMVQAGSSGMFRIHALKAGRYRIIAIRDQYKDGIYDDGTDAFGAPTGDVSLANDTPFVRLRVGHPIDRIAPEIVSAEAISNRRFAVSFSESLHPGTVRANAFRLTDSAGLVPKNIISAYLSARSASTVEIIAADMLDTTTTWLIEALRDSAVAVRDSSGNTVSDTAARAYFQAISDPETVPPVLLRPPFADSVMNIDPADTISFTFNMGIEAETFTRSLVLNEMTANGSGLPVRIIPANDNRFLVIPESRLKADTWYRLTLKTGSIRGLNGIMMADTTKSLRFQTSDTRLYSNVSGSLIDTLECGGPYVVIITSQENQRSYKTVTDNEKKWSFSQIPPGTYKFDIFCDSDRNGTYSYGNPFPFATGERYIDIERLLTVRARWNSDNIIIDMNK